MKDRAALYLIKEAEEKGQSSKQMSLTTFLVVNVKHLKTMTLEV